MGRANAGAGTGDRDTVASRHSFIPFLVRKTKSQVRKAQEKRQEKIHFLREVGGMPGTCSSERLANS